MSAPRLDVVNGPRRIVVGECRCVENHGEGCIVAVLDERERGPLCARLDRVEETLAEIRVLVEVVKKRYGTAAQQAVEG